MAKAKSYRPKGYNTVTAYLIVHDADAALDYYKRAFGAKELMRMQDKSGVVHHSEIQLGNSRVGVADEHPKLGALSPKTVGGTPVRLMVYVPNVDATIKRAVTMGAKLYRKVADQFYGDRNGGIIDPFGHEWFFATHKEDLTDKEMMARAAKQGK